VRLERFGKLKTAMTPSKMEPTIFRLYLCGNPNKCHNEIRNFALMIIELIYIYIYIYIYMSYKQKYYRYYFIIFAVLQQKTLDILCVLASIGSNMNYEPVCLVMLHYI
jgi:hypothetical protein